MTPDFASADDQGVHTPRARNRLRRRDLILGATGLVASPALVRAQGQGKGVALVIGNSRYSWEAPLPNVRRDVPSIARRFQELGLKTELIEDAGRGVMFSAIEKFKAAARSENVAALYFAGHGAAWEKDTYLVPIDSDLSSPETIKSLIPVKAISDATRGAAHRLLIFDNCRNNPADGWRQRAASDSAMVTPIEAAATALHGPNTLVLFSTAPGRVALDGPAGETSPFAAALLRQFADSPTEITALSAKLRRDLLLATDGRQVIWNESTYSEPFILDGPRGKIGPTARPAVDPSRIVELPNAYAFAREKKLILPQGLIAIRPDSNSPHAGKIGAYESTIKIPVGISSSAQAIEPVLLIVLSVDDTGVAQTILSYRYFTPHQSGPIWQFLPAQVPVDPTYSEKSRVTELRFSAKFPSLPLWWRWNDRDSGTCTSMMLSPMYQAKFKRLDG